MMVALPSDACTVVRSRAAHSGSSSMGPSPAGRGDLDDAVALYQSVGDPPLCEVVHLAEVDLVVVIEWRRDRGCWLRRSDRGDSLLAWGTGPLAFTRGCASNARRVSVRPRRGRVNAGGGWNRGV